jgi:hypothetical protein
LKAKKASYKVSLRIAEAGKPRTVGETLRLPAAKDEASNVKEQLTEKVNASKYYSVHLDGSSEVRNTAYFLTFIRFEGEESVKEELLFCLQSLGRTTSNGIFKKIVQYMKICGIEWGGGM